MKKNALIVVAILVAFHAFGQLPPIFENTPKDIYPSRKMSVFPKNSFLENLVKGHDGAFYVTNYPEGKIHRVTTDGRYEDYAKVDGKIAGIANYEKNMFLVSGWDAKGQPSIFLIDANKKTSVFAAISGGMFPNGIIPFSSNTFLIADSFAGIIWILNTVDKSVKPWLKHDLLARSSDKAQIPAANGLKVHANALYVSNSEKQLVVKIPLTNNNPGTPEVFIDKVFVDDFCFDEKGNMYAAANVYNNILKITPSKQVTIIETIEQGAAGATAVLLGKDKGGKQVLFVSTCGGMGVPPPTGIEEGKILEVTLK